MTVKSKEEVVQEFRIQTIQDAAIRVVARKGMSNATMQDIADEAGVAKGTIYLYFSDREALLEKVFDSALAQLRERLEAAFSVEGTFAEKLSALVRTKLDFFEEHREIFRIYMSARWTGDSSGSRSPHRCGSRYQAHVEEMRQFIERGIASGEVHHVDAGRMALFLTEGINAILIRRVAEEAPPSKESDGDLIVDAVLNGISAMPRKRGTRH